MDTSSAPKTLVVTGATSGIGLAAVRQLLRQGHSVIGAARSAERCQKQQEALQVVLAPGACLRMLPADLSLQSEVLRLADEIGATLQSWGRPYLDGLINNAATVPFWQTLTSEGFDLQWAVNHLAPFLLIARLLPLLERAPLARVVTVELDRRLRASTNVRAFAADPGLVKTELGFKSNSLIARWAWDIRRRGGITAEESARGVVFLATEPSIQQADDLYWKHSHPKPASPQALNPEAARQLWKLSAQMCGLEA